MTVVFVNDGLVPMEAFTSFGVSAKVGDNPIGEFGTGLKMAIAVILRLGGTIRVFRDDVEYEFYTQTREFRGKDFDWCRMRQRRWPQRWRSERLPFTTELARKWEAWQAVREIEANCRDEAGRSFIDRGEPTEYAGGGNTVIAVDCAEFEEAYGDLGSIFLDRESARLVHEGTHCRVYAGRSDYVFFKGLRVTDLPHPSLFTYEMKTGVDLTEDRTSKYPHSDGIRILTDIGSASCSEITDVLLSVEEDDRFYEMGLDWDLYAPRSGGLIGAIGQAKAAGSFVFGRMLSYYTSATYTEEVTEETVADVSLPIGSWLKAVSALSATDCEICHRAADDIVTAVSDAGWEF
jgi:hypothetical protein